MKYAVVTGAAGGMGRAVVRALVEKGYTVFALDRVEAERADGVFPIAVDLTDEESVLKAASRVREHTDTVDAVLHFAGVYQMDSLAEMASDAFEQILRVNLFSAFYVNKAFLPLLKKGARILITTSELAPLDPLPFTGIYAITKSALDKYAFSLAMELQLLGISVSVLRAGAVQTGMLGDSTAALSAFCERTELYACNAARFRRIVDRVEAKSISPERLAKKVLSILGKKRPAFAYAINRNPLLRLLSLLPRRLQLFIIRAVLS